MWVGQARFATWIIVLLSGVVAVASAAVVFVIATRGIWPLAIVPVVLLLSVLGTSSWRVRVDAAGLTVRPLLGWPLYRVAIADVQRAATTEVVPLGEFGGYGIRWGLGRRLGIITRGGEALEVLRRDGRAIVVTVDDAATAAGLLTALAARGEGLDRVDRLDALAGEERRDRGDQRHHGQHDRRVPPRVPGRLAERRA